MTSKEIDNAYVGRDQVDAIYLGSDKIYPNYVHVLSASTQNVSGTGIHNVDILASDPWTASFDGTSLTYMSFSPNSGVAGITNMTITITGGGTGDLTIEDSKGATIVIVVDNM